MSRPFDFPKSIKFKAARRQKFHCGSCGILVDKNLSDGFTHAHHILPIKIAEKMEILDPEHIASVENCVILCWPCHYSAHEGGNYKAGTVFGETDDFPYFNG
jgi:5-methylcytosine-specific restriction endonuclease McrA